MQSQVSKHHKRKIISSQGKILAKEYFKIMNYYLKFSFNLYLVLVLQGVKNHHTNKYFLPTIVQTPDKSRTGLLFPRLASYYSNGKKKGSRTYGNGKEKNVDPKVQGEQSQDSFARLSNAEQLPWPQSSPHLINVWKNSLSRQKREARKTEQWLLFLPTSSFNVLISISATEKNYIKKQMWVLNFNPFLLKKKKSIIYIVILFFSVSHIYFISNPF